MFGHAAGDELLAGLGRRAGDAVASRAAAYRLGGDEFCLLIAGEPSQELLDDAIARSARRRAFTVRRRPASVCMPREAPSARDALNARRRAHVRRQGRAKRQRARRRCARCCSRCSTRASPSCTGTCATSRALAHARRPPHGPAGRADRRHSSRARRAARRRQDRDPGLDPPQARPARTTRSGSFMRQHTLIGERILAAAPRAAPGRARRRAQPRALGRRRLSRRARRRGDPARGAHHRRVRRLRRDDLRPRRTRGGARPREALAEMQRNAGTQFDPLVVDALERPSWTRGTRRPRPRAR